MRIHSVVWCLALILVRIVYLLSLGLITKVDYDEWNKTKDDESVKFSRINLLILGTAGFWLWSHMEVGVIGIVAHWVAFFMGESDSVSYRKIQIVVRLMLGSLWGCSHMKLFLFLSILAFGASLCELWFRPNCYIDPIKESEDNASGRSHSRPRQQNGRYGTGALRQHGCEIIYSTAVDLVKATYTSLQEIIGQNINYGHTQTIGEISVVYYNYFLRMTSNTFQDMVNAAFHTGKSN